MIREDGFGVVFVTVLAFLFSVPAFAETNTCQRPTTAPLPAFVTDQNDASSLGVEVDKFSTASAEYLACLTAFANRNKDQLTAEEQADLKEKFTSHLATMRTYAVQWNEIYGAFLDGR